MTEEETPLLTVVIPSFNSGQYIDACLRSLKSEYCDEVEYILIDGGSIDRTLEVVGRYEELFRHIVSETDGGQSDALNKGFRLARGKYLTWLNSDDMFCPGAVKVVLNEIRESKHEWYAANMIYIDESSKVTRCCRSGNFENFLLSFGILNVFGPSTVFSRKAFQAHGDFRMDLHYCMDTEYWLRLVFGGLKYKRIPCYLWALRLHEGAKTASAVRPGGQPSKPMRTEKEAIRKQYFRGIKHRKLIMGRYLARLWRICNLSYVRAYWDTLRCRGRILDEI